MLLGELALSVAVVAAIMFGAHLASKRQQAPGSGGQAEELPPHDGDAGEPQAAQSGRGGRS